MIAGVEQEIHRREDRQDPPVENQEEDVDSDTDSLADFVEGENPIGALDDVDSDLVVPITRDFQADKDRGLKNGEDQT